MIRRVAQLQLQLQQQRRASSTPWSTSPCSVLVSSSTTTRGVVAAAAAATTRSTTSRIRHHHLPRRRPLHRGGAAAPASTTTATPQPQQQHQVAYSATVRALVESLASTTTSSSSSTCPLPPNAQACTSLSSSSADDFQLHELPPWLEFFESLGGRQQQQQLQPLEGELDGPSWTAQAMEHSGGIDIEDNRFGFRLQSPDDSSNVNSVAVPRVDAPPTAPTAFRFADQDEAKVEVVGVDDGAFAARNGSVDAMTTWKRRRSTVDADRAAQQHPTIDDDEVAATTPLGRVIRRLEASVRSNDVGGAIRAFDRLESMMLMEEMQDNNNNNNDDDDGAYGVVDNNDDHVVPLELLKRLSILVSFREGPPFVAHRILKLYQREHARLLQQPQKQQERQSHPDDAAAWERFNDDDEFDGSPRRHSAKPIHAADPDLINSMVGWYKSLCFNVRFFDPRKHHPQRDIQSLVRSVVADLTHLTPRNKMEVFPILVSSLVTQRSVQVGMLAQPVFQSLLDVVAAVHQEERDDDNHATTGNDMEEAFHGLSAPFLEHLLGNAKFNRHDDLPYPKILQMLARLRRPYPRHAVAVLENLFPFDNLEDTTTALRALVDLQSSTGSTARRTETGPDAQPMNDSSQDDAKDAERAAYRYEVDVSTLEVIGASAARSGNVELSLLVWDAVHVMGHRAPTPAIYENLVLVFCADPIHYGSAFTVLAEMQERGYAVPRALLRSMSIHLREHTRNLDSALAALKDLRLNGLHVTTAMLNAIMSGSAERGDIDRTLSLLEEFNRNGLSPDADSYSFAMEALGKHLSRRTRTPAGQHIKNQCLDTASALLSRMEEEGILPTHHVIRDYVELLCRTGQVGVATDIVLESVDLKTTDFEDGAMHLVGDKTIYRVAMANVKMQEFDVARRVAACSTEPLPFLWRAIEAHELGAPFVDKYMEG